MPPDQRPVLIEATSKKYKGVQAIGMVLMLLGLVIALAGTLTIGATVMGLGLAGYIVGRSGAWWHHR